MTTRALIFDFDGVLVDLEPLHRKAWQETLSSLQLNFSEKDYDERYLGLNDRDFLALRFREAKRPLSQRVALELIRQKESKTRDFFSKQIPLIDGAQDFLKSVFEKYPLSVVTGALPNEIYFVLDRLHWRPYFPIIITSADVGHGKPDPEGFLKAYEKLKASRDWKAPLRKEECLIFEDSQYGIEAAQRAGIPFIKVEGSLLPFVRGGWEG